MEKRRPIDKNTRLLVWEKYNKKSYEGKCYCCGDTIYYKNFHVGHNKARAKGGSDNISNFRPICASCNQSMKTMSIDEYIKIVGGTLNIGRKVTKRELLESLPVSKLGRLVKKFRIELPVFCRCDKDDYVEGLMNNRGITVEKIKETLKI
ncbi:HNH endonuclease [Methanosarcina sp.]|uniref:HNH endonuclease n=1 Tax=Methanosarcina sp. TaxID=2213 RepID=UPI003C7260ED